MPVCSERLRDVLVAKVETALFTEPHNKFGEQAFVGHLSEPFNLWISGGATRLPGFADRLSELLETRVRLFDPLVLLRGEERAEASAAAGPQFAQAYGLALRTA